jgi:hypothetical protein
VFSARAIGWCHLGSDFATRLERAIRRSRGELIETQAVDEAID